MNDIAPTGYIDFKAEAHRDPASVPLGHVARLLRAAAQR
jgi:hypothetical protein